MDGLRRYAGSKLMGVADSPASDKHATAGDGDHALPYGWTTAPAPQALADARASVLLLVQFSTRVQIIEVQDGVEDEEIASPGLAAPHWIIREKHDVTLS